MVDHQGLEGRLEKRKYLGNGGVSALLGVGTAQKLPKTFIELVEYLFIHRY